MEDYQQMIDRAYNFMDEIEDKRAFFAACNTTRTIQNTLLHMKDKDSDEYNRLLEKQVEAQTYIWSAVSTGMRNIILGNPKPSGKLMPGSTIMMSFNIKPTIAIWLEDTEYRVVLAERHT
ncbi:hypothetical protein ACTXT7_006305 [Hymenolepis weldensis]